MFHAQIAAASAKPFREAHAHYSAARAATVLEDRVTTLDALLSARTRSISELAEKVHVAMVEGRHGAETLRQIYLDLYQSPWEEELLDELAHAQKTIEEEIATLTEIGSDDPDLVPVIAARTEQARRIDRLLVRAGALQI